MVQFVNQHPIVTVLIVYIVCETIVVVTRNICLVFDKKTKYTEQEIK